MKPKSLQGQVISRFKKVLQETAMSDVYRSCSLSDGRSATRRPQEPGEETDREHHKLQKDDSVLFGGIKTYGLHYVDLRQQQREVLYVAGGVFWLVLCGILCHLFFQHSGYCNSLFKHQIYIYINNLKTKPKKTPMKNILIQMCQKTALPKMFLIPLRSGKERANTTDVL